MNYTLYQRAESAQNAAMESGEAQRPAVALPRSAPFRGFTSRVVNPLMRRIGARVPGYAILTHTGRRTAHRYRTPLKIFRRDGDYVIALMYGTTADWLRNVQAAGGGELSHGGRTVTVTNPRVTHDPTASLAPGYARPAFRFLRVSTFVTLTPSPDGTSAGASRPAQ